MEENYNITLDELNNLLLFKKRLVSLDIDELENIYNKYDNYCTFLDSFVLATKVDSGFLYLDDRVLKKISKIVNLRRFDNQHTVDLSDEIIGYINLIKFSEVRELYQLAYLAYQESVRNVKIGSNIDKLYPYFVYDYFVFEGIRKKNLPTNDSEMFMASFNYLFQFAPEVFEDSDTVDLVGDSLSSIEGDISFFQIKKRKLLRETRENYLILKQIRE